MVDRPPSQEAPQRQEVGTARAARREARRRARAAIPKIPKVTFRDASGQVVSIPIFGTTAETVQRHNQRVIGVVQKAQAQKEVGKIRRVVKSKGKITFVGLTGKKSVFSEGKIKATPRIKPVAIIKALQKAPKTPRQKRLEAFERRVLKLKARETAASKRAEKVANLFQAIPFLKERKITGVTGEEKVDTRRFIKRTARGVLAFPIVATVGFGEQIILAAGKAAATVEGLTLRDVRGEVAREAARAGRATPKAFVQSFDVRDPRKLANIIGIVATLGLAKGAAARIAAKKGTVKVTSASAKPVKGGAIVKQKGTYTTKTGRPVKYEVTRNLNKAGKGTVKTVVRDAKSGKVIKVSRAKIRVAPKTSPIFKAPKKLPRATRRNLAREIVKKLEKNKAKLKDLRKQKAILRADKKGFVKLDRKRIIKKREALIKEKKRLNVQLKDTGFAATKPLLRRQLRRLEKPKIAKVKKQKLIKRKLQFRLKRKPAKFVKNTRTLLRDTRRTADALFRPIKFKIIKTLKRPKELTANAKANLDRLIGKPTKAFEAKANTILNKFGFKLRQKTIIGKLDGRQVLREIRQSVKAIEKAAGLKIRTSVPNIKQLGKNFTANQRIIFRRLKIQLIKSRKGATKGLDRAVRAFNRISPVKVSVVKIKAPILKKITKLTKQQRRLAKRKFRRGEALRERKAQITKFSNLILKRKFPIAKIPKEIKGSVLKLVRRRLTRKAKERGAKLKSGQLTDDIIRKFQEMEIRAVLKRPDIIKRRIKLKFENQVKKALAAKRKSDRLVAASRRVKFREAARQAAILKKLLFKERKDFARSQSDASKTGQTTQTVLKPQKVAKLSKGINKIKQAKTPKQAKQAHGQVTKEASGARQQLILLKKKPLIKTNPSAVIPIIRQLSILAIIGGLANNALAVKVKPKAGVGVGVLPDVQQKPRGKGKQDTGTDNGTEVVEKVVTIPDKIITITSAIVLTRIITNIINQVGGTRFIQLRPRGRIIDLKNTRPKGGLSGLRAFLFKRFKKKRTVFLPDMYSIVFGVRAKAKQKVRLLRPGRIFTGIERRPQVR